MAKSPTKQLIWNGLSLSLLLHLLFVASITTVILTTPEDEEEKKPPNLFVPSYVYKGGITPTTPLAANVASPKSLEKMTSANAEPSSTPISEPEANKKIIVRKNNVSLASIMASTQNILQANKLKGLNTAVTEPIYLVGDLSQAPDPLIRLLGKALSANFRYPREAEILGIRGRVLVGLTINPKGYLSDVQMLQSSNHNDLDAAALYAVNSVTTIPGTHKYLSQPKHIVIGFIFR